MLFFTACVGAVLTRPIVLLHYLCMSPLRTSTTQHNTTQHNRTQHNTTQPEISVFLCCHGWTEGGGGVSPPCWARVNITQEGEGGLFFTSVLAGYVNTPILQGVGE